MKDSDWGLESETDLHPDVPGELSAGPDTPHLEVSDCDLLVALTAAPLTDLSRVPGYQLLYGPPHLPAGDSGLLLAPALHQVHFPAGEDGGRGPGLTDLRRR